MHITVFYEGLPRPCISVEVDVTSDTPISKVTQQVYEMHKADFAAADIRYSQLGMHSLVRAFFLLPSRLKLPTDPQPAPLALSPPCAGCRRAARS